jgi:acyl-CoA thioester hydrolase
MYVKEFEVRWSDLDANRHLANSAYTNFMSHARLSFLLEMGFSQNVMSEYNMGPVAFYEHTYYFKEVFPGRPIRVTVEVKGLSEDGMFFEFHHNFYDYKGRNLAHCEMMGAWIDLKARELTGLPEPLLKPFTDLEKSEDFRILTKADTRKHFKKPQNLEG